MNLDSVGRTRSGVDTFKIPGHAFKSKVIGASLQDSITLDYAIIRYWRAMNLKSLVVPNLLTIEPEGVPTATR